MRAKSKEKYEEAHSPRYLGFIRRDLCAAGTRFVCSTKRGCDGKGSGNSTTT
jgi:hypothetical protein